MEVKFYGSPTRPMDYSERQAQANADKVDLYVEQHFNASASPKPNYCVVVVGSNASATSKEIGRRYATAVSREFSVPIGGTDGLLIGGFNGRGDGNIRKTNMPAILLEPMFCSNPEQAEIIRSVQGQKRLADCLVRAIRSMFSDSVKIGFSIGHKYKRRNPRDRGAAVHGGGTEADYAEIVLNFAADTLGAVETPQSHTVKLGDTLWGIAQTYGVSVEKLKEWNDLGAVIHPGQVIELQ